MHVAKKIIITRTRRHAFTILILVSYFCFINANHQLNLQQPIATSPDLTRQEGAPVNLLTLKKGTLKDLYRTLKKIVQPLIQELDGIDLTKEIPEYSAPTALVRKTFSTIGSQERAWLKKRNHYVANGLNHFLNKNIPLHDVPRIGLCFSGGGLRATLLTLGFLLGAHESGLLDSVTYLTSTSGASWAVAGWIASGLSLSEFTEQLAVNVDLGLDNLIDEETFTKLLVQNILTKLQRHEIITAIDLYGPLVATLLFGEQYEMALTESLPSSHKPHLDGSTPLPIYTAIAANTHPYAWLEISPFETASPDLDAGIPTWALRHRFKRGKTDKPYEEPTLAEMLGIFGSAFSLNAYDIIRHSLNTILNAESYLALGALKEWHSALYNAVETSIGSKRILSAMIPNFTYYMTSKRLQDQPMLEVIDAGIDCNIPIAPLLHHDRHLDIIIIYDSSRSIEGAPELRRAQEYAFEHGHPFPPIEYEGIETQPMSVFEDLTDPECPTIIYIPRIKNEAYNKHFDPEECVTDSYCGTFNFDYRIGQLYTLIGLSKFASKELAPNIQAEIQYVIENHNKKSFQRSILDDNNIM